MSIVFDEIVGTVTEEQPTQPEETQKQQERQRPLPLKALRQIEAHQKRRQRLLARLIAD